MKPLAPRLVQQTSDSGSIAAQARRAPAHRGNERALLGRGGRADALEIVTFDANVGVGVVSVGVEVQATPAIAG